MKRQTSAAFIVRHLQPFGCVVLGNRSVLGCFRGPSCRIAKLRITTDRDDGFERQVGAVREVSEHVGGAELIHRIEAVDHEIVGPLCQHGPVLVGELAIAFHLRQSGEHDQHIARLFHRHPIAVGATHAVHLSHGRRISAKIVRRIIVGPQRRRRVVEGRNQHGLGQRRTQREKERRLRKQHVDRADAAVGEILFRKQQRHAPAVRSQLVTGPGLTIGQHAEGRVLISANLTQVGQQLLVEDATFFQQRCVVSFGVLQQIGRLRAIAPPIGTQLSAKVLNRIEIVVGQQHVALNRFVADRSEIQLNAVVPMNGWLVRRARGQIGVTPLNPQVIAFPRQDFLCLRSHAEHRESFHLWTIPGHRLVRGVDRQFPADAKFDLHLVRFSIRRLNVPDDVSHRASESFQVRRQRWRQERQLEFYPRVGKTINRTCRPDGHIDGGQRSSVGRLQTHDSKQLAIDAEGPVQGMGTAGPMGCVAVRQSIGRRPDAEIRIVHG